MADINKIRQVVAALIDAFDSTISPNDIIEAFLDELDAYEQLDSYFMADINKIRQVVAALIDAFDSTSSPNDIIEAFLDELDAYEQLIQTYHQK
jgi:ubiquinone biosynthesis protein UbiJ